MLVFWVLVARDQGRLGAAAYAVINELRRKLRRGSGKSHREGGYGKTTRECVTVVTSGSASKEMGCGAGVRSPWRSRS